MTRISNVDQILLLIQAHLDRLEKSKKSSRTDRSRRAAFAARPPLERVRELAAADSASQSELARALIAALLAQEFGNELANDIRFQDLIDRVNDALTADEHASALLASAIGQLAEPAER
ncbi:MAG: hypothetical protein K2P58_02600 [Hyphomonadaceae bacterium]|nr:hypothetical protein [Hyphomonadaceae bacterium]